MKSTDKTYWIAASAGMTETLDSSFLRMTEAIETLDCSPHSWVAPTSSDARIRGYGSLWSHIFPQNDGNDRNSGFPPARE